MASVQRSIDTPSPPADGTLSTEAASLTPRAKLFLRGPISSTLLRLSWPNILVMLAQSSTGLIETWWIRHLGTDALAGMASGVSGTVRFGGIVLGFAALGAVLHLTIGFVVGGNHSLTVTAALQLTHQIAAGDLSGRGVGGFGVDRLRSLPEHHRFSLGCSSELVTAATPNLLVFL